MDKTVQSQSTSWSRNPYYWRGKHNFAHIYMSNITNSNVSQAIKSHKFDVASVLDSQWLQVKIPGELISLAKRLSATTT